jgi:hypothetical protein
MDQEFEDELSMEEQQAFRALAREQMPPPLLEERVVAALKQANLLRSTKNVSWTIMSRKGLAVAASFLLFFTLGLLAGAHWIEKPARQSNLPEFMLVLRAEPEQSQPRSAAEVHQGVKEYSAWARGLRQQGVQIDGEKLKSEARFLRVVAGRTVVADNNSATGPDSIVGYFLIEAQDYEHAVKAAEGCPHLKYGGIVEVRQIDRF